MHGDEREAGVCTTEDKDATNSSMAMTLVDKTWKNKKQHRANVQTMPQSTLKGEQKIDDQGLKKIRQAVVESQKNESESGGCNRKVSSPKVHRKSGQTWERLTA
eukprot:1291029-Karenia_brevis.AAC.1